MSDIPRRGLCLVLAAPSGAGKSTITRALLAADPRLTLSVSMTTRQPRPGEVDGTHYFFTTPEYFRLQVEQGELLEWAEVFGRYYGTPKAPVEAALTAGQDVLFDIDWQGYRQLRRAMPADTTGVFILPPSLAALRDRLTARAGDSQAEIARRMQAAQAEISHWDEFTYTVVNDSLPGCIAQIQAILTATRLATPRQHGLAAFVARLTAAEA